MHPKTLLDICVDVWVQVTIDILLSGMTDKEKFLAVKQMWDELWKLPQNIPVYAGELLHSYLMLHVGENYSLCFFIALAANPRRIKIPIPDRNTPPPTKFDLTYVKCYIQNQEFHLQELDISNNFCENLLVLENIIPKCPFLKILKLGVYEKFLAVKRVWDELWKLPQDIPVYAGELLHSYLMLHVGKNYILCFCIALVANLRRINICRQICYSPPPHYRLFLTCDKYYFQNQEFHLQELNISHISGEINLSVLEKIIPKCPFLKILKFGHNVSQTLLLLAKEHCPLTTLHISAFPRGMSMKDMIIQFFAKPLMKRTFLCKLSVPLDFWMDLFFGVSNVHPTEILEGIKKGKTPYLKAAWPNLRDLRLNDSTLPDEFFVLTWIVYKKLTYVHSSGCKVEWSLEKYMHLRSEVPQHHGLTIGDVREVALREAYPQTEKGIEVLLRVASSIESIRLRYCRDEECFKIVEKLSEASLYPREIHLCDVIVKRGIYALFGKQVKKVSIVDRLEEFDIKDLAEFLLDFPALEQLHLYLSRRLRCDNEKFLANLSFPHITSLKIGGSIDQNVYHALFLLLPSLHELQLIGNCEREEMHINLKMLPELRILKLDDGNWLSLSDILDIPRDTQKSRRYELHGGCYQSSKLTRQDVKKIVNSGWNYFPISFDSFEIT